VSFFDHQDQARKKTRWLVLLFVAAVICITVAVDAIVILVAVNSSRETEQLVLPSAHWLAGHQSLLAWSSIAVVVLIASASFYRMAKLGGGGGVVARSLGGTLVPPNTSDPQHRQLRNVVEEIAIASGVPVPDIYVLESEGGINAFAAGYSINDAAVAVSRGCLDKLSRDELQGVIAHEFSHIFNGDMRLNLRLIGVLFGILMIGLAGRQILRLGFYGGSRKNGAPLAMAGLALMVVGFVGVFFGRLIQAAVSRQREFLADASAVQFTRNPGGIAGALKKIAASQSGGLLEATDGEEVGHLLFADGVGRKMMATHPPVLERIHAIEPGFSPRELGDIAARMALKPDRVDVPKTSEPSSAMGFSGDAPIPVQADDLIAKVGNPSWAHVAYAAALIDDLPEALHTGVQNDRQVIDVVLTLLIDPREAVRARQLETIESDMGGRHRQAVEALLPEAAELPPQHRLPLIELALPVLKRRPRGALKIYLEVIRKLIRADGKVDVFEYALSRLVSVYLVQAMSKGQADRAARIGRVRTIYPELVALFAVVAHVGHDDPDQARRAFSDGLDHLFPMDSVTYEPPEDWVSSLDSSLDRINRLVPLMKEQVIEGLIQTLIHDGKVTLDELEMLRSICASLHCPMPPKIEVQ
jgi:Zn-dependent protease with chaperone function